MWHWGYDFWWMGFMMMLFWAGVIALAVWGFRSRSGAPTYENRERSAISILQERYARGEIDDEEFQRRRRVLDESS